MDPRLAEHWTSMDPVRCHACTTLAEAQKRSEDAQHPHALRHILGLAAGWEDALAAGSEGAPADQ